MHLAQFTEAPVHFNIGTGRQRATPPGIQTITFNYTSDTSGVKVIRWEERMDSRYSRVVDDVSENIIGHGDLQSTRRSFLGALDHDTFCGIITENYTVRSESSQKDVIDTSFGRRAVIIHSLDIERAEEKTNVVITYGEGGVIYSVYTKITYSRSITESTVTLMVVR